MLATSRTHKRTLLCVVAPVLPTAQAAPQTAMAGPLHPLLLSVPTKFQLRIATGNVHSQEAPCPDTERKNSQWLPSTQRSAGKLTNSRRRSGGRKGILREMLLQTNTHLCLSWSVADQSKTSLMMTSASPCPVLPTPQALRRSPENTPGSTPESRGRTPETSANSGTWRKAWCRCRKWRVSTETGRCFVRANRWYSEMKTDQERTRTSWWTQTTTRGTWSHVSAWSRSRVGPWSSATLATPGYTCPAPRSARATCPKPTCARAAEREGWARQARRQRWGTTRGGPIALESALKSTCWTSAAEGRGNVEPLDFWLFQSSPCCLLFCTRPHAFLRIQVCVMRTRRLDPRRRSWKTTENSSVLQFEMSNKNCEIQIFALIPTSNHNFIRHQCFIQRVKVL